MAGIVCMQSENSNYVLDTKKGEEYFLLLERNQKLRRNQEMESTQIASIKIDISKPIRLKVSANHDEYEFSYSSNGGAFESVGGKVWGIFFRRMLRVGLLAALSACMRLQHSNSLSFEQQGGTATV